MSGWRLATHVFPTTLPTVLQGYGVDALSDGFMMVIGTLSCYHWPPPVPSPSHTTYTPSHTVATHPSHPHTPSLGRSAAQSDWPQVAFPPLEGFGAARMHVAGLQVLVQPLSDRSVRCCYCCNIDLRAPLPRPMLHMATQHVVTLVALAHSLADSTFTDYGHAPPSHVL